MYIFPPIVAFVLTTKRLYTSILGCSYRASSARIAVRLPTDATVYSVKNLFPLFLPYMFRVLIKQSSGVPQAVFLYTTIWFMWCLCCSSVCACGLVCRGGSPVLVALRVSVDWFVVVVSLEISTQNKQLHPLVTLLQHVQKMHGMNNLKF
jgi:hypothetical protein